MFALSSQVQKQKAFVEQKTHHAKHVSLSKFAAGVAAFTAGVGAAGGLWEPELGALEGQIIPILIGMTMGLVIGIGWHVVLEAGSRVRNSWGIAGTIITGVLLTTSAIAGSSWLVATAISGTHALQAHQQEAASQNTAAFEATSAQVNAEAVLIGRVRATQAKLQALRQLEIQGVSAGSGPGDGPLAKTYGAAANAYGELEEQMQDVLDEARRIEDSARAIMSELLVTIPVGDTKRFENLIVEHRGLIAELQTIRLAPLAAEVNVVEVLGKVIGGDAHLTKIALADVSKDLQDQAEAVADARRPVELPTYLPINAREATARYANEALGGWVTAIAVDVLPFLFLLFIMATAREQFLNRPVVHPEPKPEKVDPDSHAWPAHEQPAQEQPAERPVLQNGNGHVGAQHHTTQN